MAAAISGLLVLFYLAYTQPGQFTDETIWGGILLLEVLTAAVWQYRRVFFPLVIVTFLLAPFGLGFGAARWVFLAVAAAVGLVLVFKERALHFGLFHFAALLAVMAALGSAAVSLYQVVAYLKVLSLLLLFLYSATGVRIAVLGRENRFFQGLVTGCEVFVALVGACYLVGLQVMGNPNSLGAVMGVVGAPILLWGILIAEKPFLRRRRSAVFAMALYLIFASASRASMVAAFVSCGMLCVLLRRYRMLALGIVAVVIVAAATAIFRPEAFSDTASSVTSKVLYKGQDRTAGILGSRQSPWQNAVDTIQTHFWFGTGFGTSDKPEQVKGNFDAFSTTAGTSTENGSSYLSIAMWVGMLGVLPFLTLLILLIKKVFQTGLWAFRTRNPFHVAIPLSMVIVAGMIHAGLEDWMFAPGYYLCAFYWPLAFILVDQAPSPAIAQSRAQTLWQSPITGNGLENAASTQ